MIAWRPALAAVLVTSALLTGPILANETLPQPQGEIILTVTGDIARTNQGDNAVFDLAMLRDLGEVRFQTSTPWTDGVHEYAGVSLHSLARTLGVSQGTLTATALNDYAAEIPISDAVEGGPILAYMQDGDEMSVREKGPLWLVYPYDQNETYQTDVVFSRSIWQLQHIHVSAD